VDRRLFELTISTDGKINDREEILNVERTSPEKQYTNGTHSLYPTEGIIMKSAKERKGFDSLRKTISGLHDVCRDLEDGYDPLMAVDEITKLLFIKLTDENINEGEDYWFTEKTVEQLEEVGESPSSWLDNRFSESLDKSSNGIAPFDEDKNINLSDATAREFINQIAGYRLRKEDADVKGIAYEQLLENIFKNSLGQFFTPRPVVEFMVNLVDPDLSPDTGIDKVIDPGAGTGGFLTASVDVLYEKATDNSDLAQSIPNNVYGVDRSPRMPKIARTNLMLHNREGWGPFKHIYQGNSLESTGTGIPVTNSEQDGEVIPFEEFDVLLANPPFGATGGEEQAHEITNSSDFVMNNEGLEVHTETEALFVKRSVELLKPSGEMAIVIPKNLINGSDFTDLQNWLLNNCIIKSVINLPLSTFRPFNSDIKTVVLHLQKRDKNLEQGSIFFDAARYIGYDGTGKTIPENDLPDIRERYDSGPEAENVGGDTFGVFVDPDDIDIEEGGLDPLYYILNNSKLFEQISSGLAENSEEGKYTLKKVNEIAERRREKISSDNEMCYVIFAGDVDRPLGEITSISVETSDENGELGSYTVCEPNDVLYYRMRPYLRKVAVVPEELTLDSGKTINLNDVPLACSSEFCVLKTSNPSENIRAYADDMEYTPKYIWSILRSNLTLFQVLPTITGGTRPRVPFDAIMDVQVPIPKQKNQSEILQNFDTLQSEIEKYRGVRRDTINEFKNIHGEWLFRKLDMESMEDLDDGLITLLIEADILPKSYHNEFY
jgi:type I restriction-modification system DNA methylase subunit